jgi:hypothetical protein
MSILIFFLARAFKTPHANEPKELLRLVQYRWGQQILEDKKQKLDDS